MKIGVIGGSGYAGGELLRLLAIHPEFEVTTVSAHTNAGELITDVHPQLHSYMARRFHSFNADDYKECDLVFLVLPHGESAKVIVQLPAHVKVVDLGADYRLKSASSWQKYYGGDHAGTWTYGLADLPGQGDVIANSQRVANPGCYATAISLGVAPLINHIQSDDIVVVAASGTTGAGRSSKPSLSNSEISGSLTSYKFGGVHQHTPEIEEILATLSTAPVKISFTPILAPMPRGILATVTGKLKNDISIEGIRKEIETFYAHTHFVQLLPEGQMPKTASTLGSNVAQIQVAIDHHTQRVVVSIAIDNLGKGAAAQAIHNANIMSGFNPSMGLEGNGLGV
jgi:N-acetyl-gamma-glutamyl-phosphate reductase